MERPLRRITCSLAIPLPRTGQILWLFYGGHARVRARRRLFVKSFGRCWTKLGLGCALPTSLIMIASRKEVTMPRPLIIALLISLLITLGIFGIGLLVPPPIQPVTIYAHDPTSGTVMSPIHLWRDLNNHDAGAVGQITDGASVKLIRRVGDGALIELPDGTRGWVNVTFIAELH